MTDAKRQELKKRPSVKARGRAAQPKPGQSGRVAFERADTAPLGRIREVPREVPREVLREAPRAVPREASREASSRRAAGREAAEAKSQTKPKPKTQPKKSLLWLRALLLTLALVIVVAGGVFSWDRWLHYDDAADIQGTWYASGTDAAITISEAEVTLTPDVVYEYSLDTSAKTISFAFSNLTGQGRYRFSADRTQLAVIEGEGYSLLTTLCDDLAYAVQCSVANILGNPAPALGEGDAAIVLVRQAASGEAPGGEAQVAADGDAADGSSDGSADGTSAGSDAPSGSESEGEGGNAGA